MSDEPEAASPSKSAVRSKSAGTPSMRHVPSSTRSTAAVGPSATSRCSSAQVAPKPARRRSVQARSRLHGESNVGRYVDQAELFMAGYLSIALEADLARVRG